MAVSFDVIRQSGKIFLVKVAHYYHVVHYDAIEDIVTAIWSGDRVKKAYLTAKGFTAESVRFVSKGRKQETAKAYFLQLRRYG